MKAYKTPKEETKNVARGAKGISEHLRNEASEDANKAKSLQIMLRKLKEELMMLVNVMFYKLPVYSCKAKSIRIYYEY